jgi:hypothetical protein
MKYFFGWNNFKWLVRELIKMYSAEKSFFSKKRIESGIAFAIGQWGMVFYLLEKHSSLSMSEVLFWTATEFAIAGYMLNQIQKEKVTQIDPSIENQQIEQINS